MPEIIDLKDQTFGRLQVKRLYKGRKFHAGAFWECECECGNTAIVSASNLKSGNTRSCGCLRSERSREWFKSGEQKRGRNGYKAANAAL